MLRFLAYFIDLARLVADSPCNPLVVRGRPWGRFGFAFFLFAFEVVVAALLALGLPALEALAIYQERVPGAILPGFREPEVPVVLGCFAVASGVVLFPLNFLAFCSRWTEPGRLRDMYLTLMTHREAAFGSVFWGVVCGAIIPLGAALGQAGVILMYLVHEGGLRAPDEWIFPFISWLLFMYSMGCAALTVKYWFYLFRHRWPIVIVVGGLSVLFVYMAVLVGIAAATILDDLFDFHADSAGIFLAFGIPCLLFLAHQVWSAGRFAPSLFIRPIDMEPYREYCVIGNFGQKWYDRALRRRVRMALKSSVPMITAPAVAFLAAGAAALFLGWRASAAIGQSFTFKYYNIYLVVLGIVSFSAAAIAWEAVRLRGAPFPLVSGAPFGSVSRRLRPVAACALLLVIVGCAWTEGTAWDPESTPLALFILRSLGQMIGYLLLASLVVVANNIAWCLVLSFRRRWWIAAGLYVMAILAWAMWAYAYFPAQVPEQPWAAPRFEGWRAVPDSHGMLGIAAAAAMVYFGVAIVQRLFDRRIRGVPAGDVVR